LYAYTHIECVTVCAPLIVQIS